MEAELGRPVRDVWLYLTTAEAVELVQALEYWATDDPPDPQWHMHIADEDREFTLAIVDAPTP